MTSLEVEFLQFPNSWRVETPHHFCFETRSKIFDLGPTGLQAHHPPLIHLIFELHHRPPGTGHPSIILDASPSLMQLLVRLHPVDLAGDVDEDGFLGPLTHLRNLLTLWFQRLQRPEPRHLSRREGICGQLLKSKHIQL